jgi:hypothetical protein
MSFTFNTGYLFLDILLYFILVVKLVLIFITIFDNFIIKKNILSKEIIDTLDDFAHKLFYILMPLLLIILFNPLTTKYMVIDNHIRFFLFIFGVLQLIDQTKIINSIKKNI